MDSLCDEKDRERHWPKIIFKKKLKNQAFEVAIRRHSLK
jgi:hypothetical protein